ncbi:hypothetical protein RhiirA1_441394 [Rhizophagus irregularis]|uniref:Uncharacterized protein n=1 Tax=Rhizophagus irregularis TaxID=588596 RepID=A0A2N0RUS5_9GLOM|nr:hypothetical protein RhiirA1_441394 [Rhizophagus irregularis]
MSSQCIIYTVMCSPYWAVLFGYWILILPILSENRDFGGFFFSDFSRFACSLQVSDSLFLESADFLDVIFQALGHTGNLEWYHIGTLERNHFSINGTAFEGI